MLSLESQIISLRL